MNMSSTMINQDMLESLMDLLKCAVYGVDNQSQKRVYDHLSNIEENPSSYIGFAMIGSNGAVEINLRQMALLTLKSALKRNENVIQFTPEQLQQLKSLIIQCENSNNESIANAQKALISQLCTWNRSMDYELLRQLLSGLQTEQHRWMIEILYTILEDIRFQTENTNLYQAPEFQNFINSYTSIFSVLITQAKDPQHTKKLLGCMNLLIKYTPQQSEIKSKYMKSYLVPILQMGGLDSVVVLETFDGLTQLVENDNSLIIEDQQVLKVILTYQPQGTEVKKRWLSLILDIINTDNSENEALKEWLSYFVPAVFSSLPFTQEDQVNVTMEMEEEVNPYNSNENEQEDVIEENADENYENRGYDGGYTLRRLSVMCIEKLMTTYPEEMWKICEPVLRDAIHSQNYIQKQCGVLMVGIIFDNYEDHLQFLTEALPVILKANQSTLPQILRCTSLWTISKLAHLLVKEPVIQSQVQTVLVECISPNANDAQIKHTAYAALDEIVTYSECLPHRFSEIVACIQNGIKICQGRSLYSVLKICSTLYEKHSEQMPQEVTFKIVERLCERWSKSENVESIMSPILECLVTIATGHSQIFSQMGQYIFKLTINLLLKHNQKAILLRAVDLISTLISLKIGSVEEIIVHNSDFHERIVYPLVIHEDREIRNFGYGLLGDICKNIPIPAFAENYLKAIGLSFDKSNLTACSNALMCMTDLIIAHPQLNCGAEYAGSCMEVATQKLSTNNLHQFLSLNYARIYGRLGNAHPQKGVNYLQRSLRMTSNGLHAHEHQQLTDDAYRGLFKMAQLSPQSAVSNFHYLVQSFICYNCTEGDLVAIFKKLLISFKNSKTEQEWNQFLKKPNFLPAVVNKIRILSA